MASHSRQVAWILAALLIAVLAAIAVVLFLRLHRPFDSDTLAIQVAELQSQSAEAALLAQNVSGDRLAPGFAHEHLRQLADNVGRVEDALQSKAAQPGLESPRQSAQGLGATLQVTLIGWLRDTELAPTLIPRLDAVTQQLDALHKQLKPGD
ncbi:MAG: hypothetical protein JWL98_1566 [Xanthomonadaceae bacterium]|nr:hypothetical protein [Xanthomonadaceae bacterium]